MNDIRFQLPEINTWRLFNKGVTQQGVVEMVETWEANGYRFGSVCIDDGWTVNGLLGDWTPNPVTFPDMKGLVDWIHTKGYAVRLWVAPLQIHDGTEIYKKAFPDAVLKDADGKPAFYPGLGTYRLDIRTEVGREHIRSVMQRLVRDYGIDAFKTDFPAFYEPNDAFYKKMNYSFSDEDNKTMVPNFYKLVEESVKAVNPAVRVCCAKHISGCQPYIQDTICGDFIGMDRSVIIGETCKVLQSYIKGHDITPWLEMVWGEGSEFPTSDVAWHAGYLEFIAQSINYGFKIEQSFYPFEYPNAEQIRTLTNLYGPRHQVYKVIAAGRRKYSVPRLMEAGIKMDHKTRFLVATESDETVSIHTGILGTNSTHWKCRNVLTGKHIDIRSRNEFWGSTMDWCRVEFEADGGEVYEIYHPGEPVSHFKDYFTKMYGDPLATLIDLLNEADKKAAEVRAAS